MNRQRIAQILFEAIDQVNETLPVDDRLEKSEALVLLGDEGKLDSLGLVNLILGTEDGINKELSEPVSLVSVVMAEGETPPPQTLGELVDVIAGIVAV